MILKLVSRFQTNSAQLCLNYMKLLTSRQYSIGFRTVQPFSETKKSKNKLLNTYQKIKQKSDKKPNTQLITSAQSQQTSSLQTQKIVDVETISYPKDGKINVADAKINSLANSRSAITEIYKINCEGCNVILQSKDNTKYGYISQKILKQAIDQNTKQLNKGYAEKVKSRDAKILNFMHQVQKQTGIKIFNQQTNDLQNMDNVQVLMRLEDKIEQYQKEEQLLHRHSKVRKQILCFRCFSLKHHNRLPHQYDNNQGFTTDSTQFILNKLINRHKDKTGIQSVQYLYVIDAFDIIGTFQQWLFLRLLSNNLDIKLVINKIDVINKEYINQAALHAAVNKKLKSILKKVCSTEQELKEKIEKVKVFYISCNSRDGIKKLKQYLESSSSDIQMVGFPNTGKTTLLNILSKIKKSTSKVPGTTIKITEHNYSSSSKRKVYDMPGLYSQNLLYNLIQKPSLKALLTWHKRIAPGLLTNSAIIYGGKLQIQDTRIIIFGQGGACQSNNRWFIDNFKQFWKGFPELSQLKMKKYQINLQFIDGRADDLEIAGYGFIGFRLCIPNVKKTTRKLTIYLPQKVQFAFRSSILSVNDSIFHRKSAVTKKFMLERLSIDSKPVKGKLDKKERRKQKQETKQGTQQDTKQGQKLMQDQIQNQNRQHQTPQTKIFP